MKLYLYRRIMCTEDYIYIYAKNKQEALDYLKEYFGEKDFEYMMRTKEPLQEIKERRIIKHPGSPEPDPFG